MSKIFCFDIDGTICSETFGNYNKAIPFPDIVKIINCLYKQGNTIIIYTARGGTTGINWDALTESQLKKWGIKYHRLVMGKPAADVYVDDKSIKPEEFFKDYECNFCDPPEGACI